jgi:hypothetical protein
MKHLPTLIEATLKFEHVIRAEPFGKEPLVFFLGTYLRLYFCFSEYFLFSFFGWGAGAGGLFFLIAGCVHGQNISDKTNGC